MWGFLTPLSLLLERRAGVLTVYHVVLLKELGKLCFGQGSWVLAVKVGLGM